MYKGFTVVCHGVTGRISIVARYICGMLLRVDQVTEVAFGACSVHKSLIGPVLERRASI
jgi:hypothetical protein